MESTQNKIYEIEDSALIDESLKNAVDDDLLEECKDGGNICPHSLARDDDLYNDQFDDNLRKEGSQDPALQLPKNGISVEISLGGQGQAAQAKLGTCGSDAYIAIKT